MQNGRALSDLRTYRGGTRRTLDLDVGAAARPQLPLQLEEAVGEPASLIATVLSRRSEATAVASNQLLNAEFSAECRF